MLKWTAYVFGGILLSTNLAFAKSYGCWLPGDESGNPVKVGVVEASLGANCNHIHYLCQEKYPEKCHKGDCTANSMECSYE